MLQHILLFLVILYFCRNCKIKEEETEAKTIRQNCKNAFSDCKKASSKGFKVLSSCHRSVSQMVQMKTRLSSNLKKMGEVETSIKTGALSGRKTKANLNCDTVLSIMSRIIELAHVKPSASRISELCSSILESNINCNGRAENALQNSTKAFVAATLMVNQTLNVIHANLLSKY